MTTPSCPNSQRLTAYSHGELPDAAAEEIADHLDQCPSCEQTVRDLERHGNTLIELLRAPLPQDPHLAEPECQRSLEELQKSGTTLPLRGPKTVTASVEANAPTLGMIRDYELLEKLGEGGMGTVYKARHSKLKRLVALKVLPTGKLDAAAVARFEREMEAAGKMHHLHIVGATDAGEQDGTHFLVMEYVAGRDLAKVIDEHGPLAAADACEIIRQAAAGLQCAHEHGLVHRDIKPSNLMLAIQPGSETSGRRDAIVKILDLGLALLFETQSPKELTNSGQVMGTLDYMAPEQVADAHRVDARADVYGLGATLYKLLTGVAVYHGPAYSSALQKLNALANVEAPPIQSVRPDLPSELAAIVHRMLAKDPAARPQSARETAALLQPFTAGHDLAALVNESGAEQPRRQVPLNAPLVSPAARSRYFPAENSSAAQHPVAASRTGGSRSSSKLWIALGLGAAALMFLMILITVVTYLAHGRSATPIDSAIPTLGPYDTAHLVADNTAYGSQMYFQTTGATVGQVWGTFNYTKDSSIAAAAVHAGVLRAGERGVIKITFGPGLLSYAGSVRNGVTSVSWRAYPMSFHLERATVDEALAAIRKSGSTVIAATPVVADVQVFTVTGTTAGIVWGTDVYSADSSIPAAAVHAGVLKPGETGRVKIEYLAGRDGYVGTTRNGMTSMNYGSWPRSMRILAARDEDGPAAGVIEPTADPFVLATGAPGQVHLMKLTGNASGAVWGSDVYTGDSSIPTAAVHAGVLKPGESGVVKIILVPGQDSYEAKSRNGVMSYSWSKFPLSFRVELASDEDLKPKPAAGPSNP